MQGQSHLPLVRYRSNNQGVGCPKMGPEHRDGRGSLGGPSACPAQCGGVYLVNREGRLHHDPFPEQSGLNEWGGVTFSGWGENPLPNWCCFGYQYGFSIERTGMRNPCIWEPQAVGVLVICRGLGLQIGG